MGQFPKLLQVTRSPSMYCTNKNTTFCSISLKRGSNTVAVMNILFATIFFIEEFILALSSDFGRDFDFAISRIEDFFFPTMDFYEFRFQKILLIVINISMSFLLIVNILLLFGTTQRKHRFLLPWLVFHLIFIMASTIVSALIIYITSYYRHYNLNQNL